MKSIETLPERQIVPVTVIKDANGRLGLKVTGIPSGIYVDEFDVNTVKKDGNMFKKGDRIVAINGRSLENVKYENALEMMRRSNDAVQFLVSQITDYWKVCYVEFMIFWQMSTRYNKYSMFNVNFNFVVIFRSLIELFENIVRDET